MTRTRLLLAAALAALLAGAAGWARTGAEDPVWQRKREMLDVVVRIETADGWGSGTVIHSGDDGVYVLTNHHVMPLPGTADRALKIQTWIYEDAESPAMPLSPEVEIVADDPDKDLTLLRVSDPEWRSRYVAAVIDARDRLQPTEDVYVVGAGLAKPVFATEGRVSLTYVGPKSSVGPAVEMVSAPTIFGNSGGAAFVMRGGHYVLAGVPEAIDQVADAGALAPVPHMAYAITMAEVRDFLRRNGRAGLLERAGRRG